MFRSEVEEWLYSIGLEELYNYFVEDGFTSLDAVRRMRQSDIDAIVDRKGYMIILNEEIDRLNYGDYTPPAHVDFEPQVQTYENRESLISRYENGAVPAVGFASRHLARRAKSVARKTRGSSVAPRASVERYVPNSASEAFESLMSNRRAVSVAASNARDAEYSAASAALLERQRKRDEERQRRAKTGKKSISLSL